MKAWKHFKTITYHKFLVMKGCFAVGLYKQGLLHDLSKYMPIEFGVGVKYYQGNCSPNDAERRMNGYSIAWIHHKGHNKHHYEYWMDYSTTPGRGIVPIPMPIKYVVEMFMDRVAASKVYNGKMYTDKDPLAYFLRGKATAPIHEDTKQLLENLLRMLADKGEAETYTYIKKQILGKQTKQNVEFPEKSDTILRKVHKVN